MFKTLADYKCNSHNQIQLSYNSKFIEDKKKDKKDKKATENYTGGSHSGMAVEGGAVL